MHRFLDMPTGVYIKFDIHFFCNFFNFKSIGEKICILFTNWGKNMHFPPFFHPLSIIFFPNMLFAHIFFLGGGGKKNIHPCMPIVFDYLAPTLRMPPFYRCPSPPPPPAPPRSSARSRSTQSRRFLIDIDR